MVLGSPGMMLGEGFSAWLRGGSGLLQLQLFFYLQLLDFMTTLIGMRIGLNEASPFVRYLMQMGPATGLAMSKLLAILLCGACIWLNKRHLVRWINYWYAGLVVWNMALIAGVLGAR